MSFARAKPTYLYVYQFSANASFRHQTYHHIPQRNHPKLPSDGKLVEKNIMCRGTRFLGTGHYMLQQSTCCAAVLFGHKSFLTVIVHKKYMTHIHTCQTLPLIPHKHQQSNLYCCIITVQRLSTDQGLFALSGPPRALFKRRTAFQMIINTDKVLNTR